jgi:hypothetical protein
MLRGQPVASAVGMLGLSLGCCMLPQYARGGIRNWAGTELKGDQVIPSGYSKPQWGVRSCLLASGSARTGFSVLSMLASVYLPANSLTHRSQSRKALRTLAEEPRTFPAEEGLKHGDSESLDRLSLASMIHVGGAWVREKMSV